MIIDNSHISDIILISKFTLISYDSRIKVQVIDITIDKSEFNGLFIMMIIIKNWKSIIITLKYKIIYYILNEVVYQKS